MPAFHFALREEQKGLNMNCGRFPARFSFPLLSSRQKMWQTKI
jgi:hypothetical protein